MRSVLASNKLLAYLSAPRPRASCEARDAYARYRLSQPQHPSVRTAQSLLPWTGSRSTVTLAAQLSAAGLDASDDGLIITVANAATDHVRTIFRSLSPQDPPIP